MLKLCVCGGGGGGEIPVSPPPPPPPPPLNTSDSKLTDSSVLLWKLLPVWKYFAIIRKRATIIFG